MGSLFSRNQGDDQDDGKPVYKGLSPKALQQLDEQLKQVNPEPIFRDLFSAQKVTKLITADHIECDFLREIFKGNSELALALLNDSRLKNEWELGYEHDILLAYWLAIQKENIRVASALVDFDQSLREMTTLAILGKNECPYSDKPILFPKATKKRKAQEATANQSEILSGNSPGLKDEASNSAILSVDDKSGASIADKSQHEGGSKSKPGISKPKVNDIGMTVTDLFEGGSSSHCSHSGCGESDDDSGSSGTSHDADTSQDEFDNLKNIKENEEKLKDSDDESSEDAISDSKAKVEQTQTKKQEGELPPAFKLDNHNITDYLYEKDITGKIIELTEIKTKWQIKKIKVGFQLNFPKTMAYIIKILLHRKEVDLACYLTAFYNFTLEEAMLLKAIKMDQYKWINYVWAFHKNYYEYKEPSKPDSNERKATDPDEEEEEEQGDDMVMIVNGQKVLNVDLRELFRLVILCYTKDGNQIVQQEIEKCCLWYLNFSEDTHNNLQKIHNLSSESNQEQNTDDNQKPNPFVDAINKIKQKFTKNTEEDNQEKEDDSQDAAQEDSAKSNNKDNNNDKNQPVENILKALLSHMMDHLALKYMGYYYQFLTEELFLFSLDTNNTQFIKKSLIMGAFDKSITSNASVVFYMIGLLEVGSKTNFLLNTMLLVDVSTWKNDQITELISSLEAYANDTYDQNRLLLSYNPMQAIALSAEILDTIARSRKRFENQCNNLKDDLLELGKYYNSKVEEHQFENLLMDKDFENRTVLKIITASQFAQLMHEDDPKAENIMGQIYVGKESTQCDGNIYGYSTFMHILTQKPKKIAEGIDVDFMDMITIDFEYKTDVDYTFQHRYRSKSINMYFIKEMIFGFITTSISIMIYYTYLESFSGNKQYIITVKNKDGTITSKLNNTLASNSDLYDYAALKQNLNDRHNYLSDEIYHETIKENYVKFIGTWSYVQYGLTAMLLLTLAMRLYFNMRSKVGVNAIAIDRYLKVDIIFAAYSIMVFWYIQIQDASILYGPQKSLIDWAVAIVFVLALGRYFLLQLVVSEVSKMLLTLIYMVIDCIAFAVIMFAYMYMATQLFSTRYQDINTDQYGSIQQSLMTTFDAMMGGYVYSGVKEDEWVYTLIIIFHIFFINILMLNFMIAILSTTYGDMLESGSFLYKCALYNYCERYMIAFSEPRLGELVVHSPPMNIFALLILPFTIIPDIVDAETNEVQYSFMAKVSNIFSIFIFWLENVIAIAFFMIFELCLMTFVYLITFFNIIYSTPGLFTTAAYIIFWTMFGIFYLIYILMKDTYMLMWILSCHRGCIEYNDKNEVKPEQKNDKNEVPLEEDFERKIGVYNDLRNVVIEMYLKAYYEVMNIQDETEDMDPSQKLKFMDELRNVILTRLNQDEKVMKKKNCWCITDFDVKLVAIQDEWKKSKVTTEEDGKKDDKKEAPDEHKDDNPVNLSQDEDKTQQKLDPKDQQALNSKQRLQQQLIGAQRQGKSKDHQDATEIKDALILFEGEENKEGDEEDEDNDKKQEFPADEYKLVGDILNNFLIGSESAFLDTVNLVLMLRALPNKIVKFNLRQSMLFNFANLQNSLIAFQTKDQVAAFEHYDVINRGRIQNIRDCIIQQNNDLDQVHTIMETIEDYVENYHGIIHDFDHLWKGWEKMRLDKENEIKRGKEQKDSPRDGKNKKKGGKKGGGAKGKKK